MRKTKRKIQREKKFKASEKKFFIYSIVITLVILVLIFLVLKSVVG